jgi:3-oxoacyl-[acyl-carrier-protein] synthase-3
MAERYAHIVGWGMYAPSQIMSNHEIAQMVDTSDEWIVTRTGIRERRIASPKETTFSMALRAAQAALELAGEDPEALDLIIVSTATPEYIFPATACLVQDALGAKHAAAFDLSAACTGFIYALSMASNAIRAGSARTVLVIGAETLSRIVNWKDRGTCILFGDGAGALLLRASEQPGGVLSTYLRADGSGANLLIVPGGGSRNPATAESVAAGMHTVHMDGREVFRFATRALANAAREVIAHASLSPEQIALVIPHQANTRIVEAAARLMNLPMDKFFLNIERYGNTSSASIPIAICEAAAQKRMHPDDHIVLVGFGGGMTWGAALVQWDVTPIAPSRWRRLGLRSRYTLARGRSWWTRLLRRIESWLKGPAAGEKK